jgi:TM2 domain-containing membrane protein YozV
LSLLCPYCRTTVTEDDSAKVACEACSTPHHGDCWAENGGCTLFGCKNAPPDEPKVQVSSNDVVAAVSPMAVSAAPVVTGFGDASVVRVVSAPRTDSPSTPPPPPPPPTAVSGDTEPQPRTQASPAPGYIAPGSIFATAPDAHRVPKSRIAFVLLGIFLGSLGVHNFYAGYIKRGILQAVISVCTLGYAAVVAWIWAIAEVCTVDRDARNINFI